MKTERITIEIMGPDKHGNGGIKISQRGKELKWYYHNSRTQKGLVKLKRQVIHVIGRIRGVL